MDFANVFARFLFQNGGAYTKALRDVRSSLEQGGCEVAQLTHRNSQALATLACDVMLSDAFESIRSKCLTTFGRFLEFRSISIDATYKLSLKVMGQRRTHGHNWVSVMGTRGSPLALFENRGESVTGLTEVLNKSGAGPVQAPGQ